MIQFTEKLEEIFRSNSNVKTDVLELLYKELNEPKQMKVIMDLYRIFKIDVDLLTSFYYKSDTNKSVKMVISDGVKELIPTKYRSMPMIKRLNLDGENPGAKVKASYICKNNMNFISLIKGEDKMKLIYLSKSKFQKIMQSIATIAVMRFIYMHRVVILKDNLDKNSLSLLEALLSRINSLEDPAIASTASSIAYNLNICMFLFKDSEELQSINIPRDSRSISQNKFIDSKNNDLSRLERIIQLELSSYTTECGFSSFIQNTLDRPSIVAKELNENTKIEKIESINPISGFVSIKNKRVLSEDSDITQDELDNIVSENKSINELFEHVAAKFSEYELMARLNKDVDVKVVSGEEILTLYEVTSYYNQNKTSTLTNSCMRHPNYKHKISFYANNSHFIKMIAVTVKATGKLKARAIVWYDKETDTNYVDRIFYSSSEDQLEIFNYINAHSNFKSIHATSYPKYVPGFKMKFPGVNPSKSLPYFDSIQSYLSVDADNNFYIMGRDTDVNKGLTRTSISLNSVGVNSIKHGDIKMCPICGKSSVETIEAATGVRICASHVVSRIDDSYLIRRSRDRYEFYETIPKGQEQEAHTRVAKREEYVYGYISATNPHSMRPVNQLIATEARGTIVCMPDSHSGENPMIIYSISKSNGQPLGVPHIHYSGDRSSSLIYYDDTMKLINLECGLKILMVKDENHPLYEKCMSILALILEQIKNKDNQFKVKLKDSPIVNKYAKSILCIKGDDGLSPIIKKSFVEKQINSDSYYLRASDIVISKESENEINDDIGIIISRNGNYGCDSSFYAISNIVPLSYFSISEESKALAHKLTSHE